MTEFFPKEADGGSDSPSRAVMSGAEGTTLPTNTKNEEHMQPLTADASEINNSTPVARLRQRAPLPVDWMDDAACATTDPDLFSPVPGDNWTANRVKQAKAICAVCLVTSNCLQYALKRRIKYGVWGGKSGSELQDILRLPEDELD